MDIKFRIGDESVFIKESNDAIVIHSANDKESNSVVLRFTSAHDVAKLVDLLIELETKMHYGEHEVDI